MHQTVSCWKPECVIERLKNYRELERIWSDIEPKECSECVHRTQVVGGTNTEFSYNRAQVVGQWQGAMVPWIHMSIVCVIGIVTVDGATLNNWWVKTQCRKGWALKDLRIGYVGDFWLWKRCLFCWKIVWSLQCEILFLRYVWYNSAEHCYDSWLYHMYLFINSLIKWHAWHGSSVESVPLDCSKLFLFS